MADWKRGVLISIGFFCAVTLAAGCNRPTKGVILKGKLLKDGMPLSVSRPDLGIGWVRIDLIPDGTYDHSESTRANPDGTFEFVGLGQGVVAGKYSIAVYHYEHGPQDDSLHGAFAAEKTPLSVDVPPEKVGSTHELGVIDLSTKK